MKWSRRAVWLPALLVVAVLAIAGPATAATPQQKRIAALSKQVKAQQATIANQRGQIVRLTQQRDQNYGAMAHPALFELVWSLRDLLHAPNEVITSSFDSEWYRSVTFTWGRPL